MLGVAHGELLSERAQGQALSCFLKVAVSPPSPLGQAWPMDEHMDAHPEYSLFLWACIGQEGERGEEKDKERKKERVLEAIGFEVKKFRSNRGDDLKSFL